MFFSTAAMAMEAEEATRFGFNHLNWTSFCADLGSDSVSGWLQQFIFAIGQNDAVSTRFVMVDVRACDPRVQVMLYETIFWALSGENEEQRRPHGARS